MIRSNKDTLSKNLCNNSFISRRLLFTIRDFNAFDESRCKSKTYKTRKQSSYLVCTLTFLPCQFHSLFLFNFKKRFSLTGEMNLQIKEFNCEKAGFRAIHTENDVDRLISCRRIINDAKDFSTHQWNFLASIALSLRGNFPFQGISSTYKSRDIDFFRTDFYKWYHSQWNS